MFSITSRLNKLSLCYLRVAPATSHCISTSSPARKLTLEDKLGIGPKPKKPMTVFFKYAQEVVRPTLIRDNPKLVVTEVVQIAAEQWKKAGEDFKKKLSIEYQEEMKRYREAMENYKQELARVDPNMLRQLQLAPKIKKEKNALKKQRTELGCPKRPSSAYILYQNERRAEFSKETPNKEIIAKITEEWKTLDAAKKEKYVKMWEKNKAAYVEDMAQWEREMRDTGNAHLLSPKKASAKRPKSQ